jgi:hypothetical protein
MFSFSLNSCALLPSDHFELERSRLYLFRDLNRLTFRLNAISGAASLFKRRGSNWSMIKPEITADDAKPLAEFGTSFSISRDSILIRRRPTRTQHTAKA